MVGPGILESLFQIPDKSQADAALSLHVDEISSQQMVYLVEYILWLEETVIEPPV